MAYSRHLDSVESGPVAVQRDMARTPMADDQFAKQVDCRASDQRVALEYGERIENRCQRPLGLAGLGIGGKINDPFEVGEGA